MKVRCIRLFNPNTEKEETQSSWLSIGNVYNVLSVYMDDRRILLLRLIGDDCITPALHDIRNFEIVSPVLPSNWILRYAANGTFELAPESWMRTGFWEKYFDCEQDAVAAFEKEKEKAIRTDP